jgi:hypothetical protein
MPPDCPKAWLRRESLALAGAAMPNEISRQTNALLRALVTVSA